VFTDERRVEFLDVFTIKPLGWHGQEKYAQIAPVLDISDNPISGVYY